MGIAGKEDGGVAVLSESVPTEEVDAAIACVNAAATVTFKGSAMKFHGAPEKHHTRASAPADLALLERKVPALDADTAIAVATKARTSTTHGRVRTRHVQRFGIHAGARAALSQLKALHEEPSAVSNHDESARPASP